MKNIFWATGLAAVLIYSVVNYFFVSSIVRESEIAVGKAQEEVRIARDSLEMFFDMYNEIIKDIDERTDSLEAVIDSAGATAAIAQEAFSGDVERLTDSLTVAGDTQTAMIVSRLAEKHDSVVHAMERQIVALTDERALLRQRIEMSDSLLSLQMDLNSALQQNIVALEKNRDAWRAKANPSLPKRLLGQAPAILTGAVLVAALR
jgi:hypothetical protein